MKDKAKNALKHKVEVAGKTIPTMIIIGLFLVGGGSAALLSSFGSVSGTADVDQAIVFGDSAEPDGKATIATFDTSESEDDVVAGTSYVDTVEIENNLETTQQVRFNSTQEFTTTVGDQEDSSGDVEGLRTGFLAMNGFNATVESTTETEDDAYVEFIIDQESADNLPAALLRVEKGTDKGTAYAGIKFDVSGTTFTGDNTVSAEYRAGSEHVKSDDTPKLAPDWVYYNITATEDVDLDSDENMEIKEGERYVVSTVAASGGGSSYSETFDDFSNVIAYEVGTEDRDFSASDLVDKGTVEQVKFATGTQDDGASSELYLYEASFAGEDLMRSIPHTVEGEDGGVVSYEVPPGTHDVKVVNELDVAAYPGSYTVSAEALPQ